MKMPLSIAIDFDDTFTADPSLWSQFIQDAKQRGHRFYCVTARQESQENADTINEVFDQWRCQMPIVFTDRSSKITAMKLRGTKIDIWIDDNPMTLVHGY